MTSALIFIVLVLAAGGVAAWLLLRPPRVPSPQQLAGGGLVPESADTLVGTVQGSPVRVWIQHDQRPHFAARVAVRCDLRIPAGLRVDTPELAPLGIQRVSVRSGPWGYTLVCRGQNLRRLQSNASLGEVAVVRQGQDHGVFGVHCIHADGWLEVGASQLSPPDLLPLTRDLVDLVELLAEQVRQPWLELAGTLGLQLGPVVHGRPSISGHSRGVDVLVQHTGSELLVVLMRRLPAMVLAHKDLPLQGPPRLELSDPVLSMLLQARGQAGGFLQDAERVQRLLPALHGHPGSVLDHEGLRMKAEDLDQAAAEATVAAFEVLAEWEGGA